MSISDKIKTFDNKSKQNKAQCNLDWETANISALSSENVSKYDFLTGNDVLPEKDFMKSKICYTTKSIFIFINKLSFHTGNIVKLQ